MKNKLKIVALIAPIILLLDQFTKSLIVKYVPYGTRITVFESFFDIVHARNKGAAFGFLNDWSHEMRDPFFYVVSLIAIVFLFYFLKQVPDGKRWNVVPIALIFGGALGNVTDRIFRGSVVDFLSVHWYDKVVDWTVMNVHFNFDLVWPAFNVADSAICVGVVWLLFFVGRMETQQ